MLYCRCIWETGQWTHSRQMEPHRAFDSAGRIFKFSSSIIIKHEAKTIDAKSVINVMAAGIKQGMTVTLICDGADEEKAMKTLSEIIESGLGELTTRY